MGRSDKLCPRCGVVKRLDAFGRDASRPDGRYSYCKECRRSHDGPVAERLRLFSKGLKRCNCCKAIKSISEFNKDSTKPEGLYSRCAKCVSDSRRVAVSKRRERREYLHQLWTSGKSECSRCRKVKTIGQFPKSIRKSRPVASWCKPCANKYRKEYLRFHIETGNDYCREDVFLDDEYVCYLCEEQLDPDSRHPNPKSPTIDHVVPLSKGGADARNNVRTACLQCNLRKSNLDLDFYLAKSDSLNFDDGHSILVV